MLHGNKLDAFPLKVLANAIRQQKEKKYRLERMIKKKKKTIFVHIWHAHHLFRKNVKTSEKVRYCSKFAKYKSTSNEQLEFEIKNPTLFILGPKEEYLCINLTIYVRDLHEKL